MRGVTIIPEIWIQVNGFHFQVPNVKKAFFELLQKNSSWRGWRWVLPTARTVMLDCLLVARHHSLFYLLSPKRWGLEACMGTGISQHSLARVLCDNRRYLHKIWNVGNRWTPLSGSLAERSRCVVLADGGSSEVCTVPCEPQALGSASLGWLVFSGCCDFLLWDLEVSLGVRSHGFPCLLLLQPL